MKYFFRNLGLLLIFSGIGFYALAGFWIWERNNSNRLAFDNYKPEMSRLIDGDRLPVRIIINNLKIDLPIYPAEIKNNIWETTDRGVSYLVSSVVPGEFGNSIIYGHDWMSLFGPLKNIKKGDVVRMIYSDGTSESFKIKETVEVSYTNTEILKDVNSATLTLYTCSGFLDSKRFVAVASLQK